ncbi:MAG: hypothetical protein P1Q69_04650, partial [Candidatus Thorarchaeota archaeon]|nr:hypothetical protein [Candidatus Thorarchaeota archaeon]
MRLVSLVLTVAVLGIFLSNPTNVGNLIDAPNTLTESKHFLAQDSSDYEIMDPIIITMERSFELTGWSGSGTFE